MGAKEIVSYVGGIVIFGLVSLLFRGRIGAEFAFGIGWLAMQILGFPMARFLSAKPITFIKWAAYSTLGALVVVLVLFALNRLA